MPFAMYTGKKMYVPANTQGGSGILRPEDKEPDSNGTVVWCEGNVSEKSDNFIITSEVGTVKDPNNFTYVAFKRILRTASMNHDIRFHDLRHTHATQLLKSGVDVKSVSERLGHASIRITLDTYTHVLPGMKDKIIQKLNDLNLTGM